MTPTRSNLFRLPQRPRVIGLCGLCQKLRRMIAKDDSAGWLLCRDCVPDVLIAERALSGMAEFPLPKGVK